MPIRVAVAEDSLLVREGFVVLHTDYRGHAGSDDVGRVELEIGPDRARSLDEDRKAGDREPAGGREVAEVGELLDLAVLALATDEAHGGLDCQPRRKGDTLLGFCCRREHTLTDGRDHEPAQLRRHRRPDRGIARVAGRVVQPRVVAEFARVRNRMKGPDAFAAPDDVSANISLRVFLRPRRGSADHRRADDDHVADDHRRRRRADHAVTRRGLIGIYVAAHGEDRNVRRLNDLERGLAPQQSVDGRMAADAVKAAILAVPIIGVALAFGSVVPAMLMSGQVFMNLGWFDRARIEHDRILGRHRWRNMPAPAG